MDVIVFFIIIIILSFKDKTITSPSPFVGDIITFTL